MNQLPARCDVQKVGQQVLEEGYFQVDPVVPRQEAKLIADAVRTVVDHGFPAPFVLVHGSSVANALAFGEPSIAHSRRSL
jgi:hypothetical protein